MEPISAFTEWKDPAGINSWAAPFKCGTSTAKPRISKKANLGCQAIATHVPGNVWKICVQKGDVVKKGDTLVVVESMKMEINIEATCDGSIEDILCSEGTPVNNGQNLLILKG